MPSAHKLDKDAEGVKEMSLFVLNWALLASHFKQLSFHLLKHPGFPAQTLNLLASSFKYLALIQHATNPPQRKHLSVSLAQNTQLFTSLNP